jgi:hypothetical protein
VGRLHGLPLHGAQLRSGADAAVLAVGQLLHARAGQGQITLSNMQASSSETDINTPVDISVNVSGNNIGHIKLFVGYFDPAVNSLNVMDSDFLESAEVREVSGVFYPGWPDGDFDDPYTGRDGVRHQ